MHERAVLEGAVSLVVFTDARGERWRAWNIEPDSVRQASFLGEEFRSGWLCFESEITGERRRLADVPSGWETMAPDRLDLLCRAATLVTRRTPERAIDAQPDNRRRP